MRIVCVKSMGSTHTFLCEQIRSKKINENFAIYALEQTNGVGSRENSWQGLKGNLHLSFCIKEEDLAKDLSLASVSIYFAYLFKELLEEKGSRIWLKWPNDLYLDNRKAGGLISSKISNFIVGGVGFNLASAPKNRASSDIKIPLENLVCEFLKKVEKKISWKDIFSKYVLEFENQENLASIMKAKFFT